jgi:hypothetical protein
VYIRELAEILMEDITEIFNYHYWIDNADRLKYSAVILQEKLVSIQDEEPDGDDFFIHNQQMRSLLEVNYLLLGYAIENLLKGYAVFLFRQTSEFPVDADFKFLSKSVWGINNGHELKKLAQSCRLSLDDKDVESLSKLESHTVWRGRYHIPKSMEQITASITPGVGITYSKQDRDFIDELFSKIRKKIDF